MTVTWEGTIKDYFTDEDVTHMLTYGIDLRSYDDVKAHSVDIYSRVTSTDDGFRMPPPPREPWIIEWQDNFKIWIDTGYPE